jgi:hypothetical protein
MLAPVEGEHGKIAEEHLIHEFGTNSKLRFVLPEFVESKIEEKQLQEKYRVQPVAVLTEIADELKVNGVIYGNVQTNWGEYGSSVSVNFKLLDTSRGTIVASSLEEQSSLWLGEVANLKDVMDTVKDDFRLFLRKIKPSFDS